MGTNPSLTNQSAVVQQNILFYFLKIALRMGIGRGIV